MTTCDKKKFNLRNKLNQKEIQRIKVVQILKGCQDESGGLEQDRVLRGAPLGHQRHLADRQSRLHDLVGICSERLSINDVTERGSRIL